MAPLDMTASAESTVFSHSYQLALTERAADQVKKIAQEGQALRIGAYEGGCSGVKVGFDLTPIEQDDVIFEAHGVKYVTDAWALENLLDGATIDYLDEGVRARFVVMQPAASTGCGCGSSFNKIR